MLYVVLSFVVRIVVVLVVGFGVVVVVVVVVASVVLEDGSSLIRVAFSSGASVLVGTLNLLANSNPRGFSVEKPRRSWSIEIVVVSILDG